MHLFSLTIDDHGDRTHSSVEDRRVLVQSSDSSLAAQVSAICIYYMQCSACTSLNRL